MAAGADLPVTPQHRARLSWTLPLMGAVAGSFLRSSAPVWSDAVTMLCALGGHAIAGLLLTLALCAIFVSNFAAVMARRAG